MGLSVNLYALIEFTKNKNNLMDKKKRAVLARKLLKLLVLIICVYFYVANLIWRTIGENTLKAFKIKGLREADALRIHLYKYKEV